MIGLVTDSNSMLPSDLAARLDVPMVPLSVTVSDDTMAEDGTIDLAHFYRKLRSGATVTTAAPAPGQIAAAYEVLVSAGATEIVSVHVGAGYSATVSAAHVASRLVGVPVHIVDSGTASFALACCVWAAAEVRARNGDATEMFTAAKSALNEIVSAFTVGEPERARAGGRLDVATPDVGVPVLAIQGADVTRLGDATCTLDAIEQITSYFRAHLTGPVRIGVGDADNADGADALADALSDLDQLDELVRYRVGPTVAAHTGAGTFGAVAWMLDR